MRSTAILFLILFCFVTFCDCTYSSDELGMEARGKKKKKKIALFVYFADLVVKKIFVLKLIYAFVLWCVIHKAGYFLTWFVSYLKEKKHEHHHVPHYDHHGPHYEYSHGSHSYGPYGRSWQ